MYLGLGFAFGLAACGLWPVRVLAEACAVCSGICFTGAALATIVLIKDRYFRSRYDIRRLIELQDREELEGIQLDEPAEYDSVHCLNCGEVYNIRMLLCPNCGAAPGSHCTR